MDVFSPPATRAKVRARALQPSTSHNTDNTSERICSEQVTYLGPSTSAVEVKKKKKKRRHKTLTGDDGYAAITQAFLDLEAAQDGDGHDENALDGEPVTDLIDDSPVDPQVCTWQLLLYIV